SRWPLTCAGPSTTYSCTRPWTPSSPRGLACRVGTGTGCRASRRPPEEAARAALWRHPQLPVRLGAPDPERALHAACLVVSDAAPVLEASVPESERLRGSRSRQRLPDRVDVRTLDALELEIVWVLAEVRKLDRYVPGGNARAGEGKAILVRDGLDARREGGGLRRPGPPGATESERAHGNEEHERGECEVPAPGAHFRSAGRTKLAALGMIAAASVVNHCSRREQ